MGPSLPTAVLGRTGIEVTRLGYGGAHARTITPTHAGDLLNAVVDSGINFIDTSSDYMSSEEWIGTFLSRRYGEFHIATKCGCTTTMLPGDRNGSEHVWTRDNLLRGTELSLKRLGRDSLEVIQLHNPTVRECESGRLVETLADMRGQGLVKWIGVSTTLPHLPVYLDWGVFDTFQIPYSALEREHEEWITRAADTGVGTVVRGGVARGEPGVDLGGRGRWDTFKRASLDELLGEDEKSSAFLLRFALSHPAVHTVVVGTTDVGHLRDNVEAAERGPLPADVYAEAKRRLDEAGEKPATAD